MGWAPLVSQGSCRGLEGIRGIGEMPHTELWWPLDKKACGRTAGKEVHGLCSQYGSTYDDSVLGSPGAYGFRPLSEFLSC